MFRPSLRISILNEKLCLPTQPNPPTSQQFHRPSQKQVPKLSNILQINQIPNVPSTMISDQILEKTTFSNNGNFTHVFTPLSYDFKQYPKVVKELIKPNPKSAQAGRIKQVNYVIFQKTLVLWSSIPGKKQAQNIKIHRFQQRIEIVQFSVLKNRNLFKCDQITIMAISFQNRMKLFKLDEQQLGLIDLMLKYKLKSCSRIQKITFTDRNEIVFGGDSGQICMVSFNKNKETLINVKSAILKKYLSKSSFDYSTRHIIKDIQVGEDFIYCLQDRISKSSYLMYFLKNTINKVIKLRQQPKYYHEQTNVNIYKLEAQRTLINFVDQLKQKQIQKKIKQGYVNFWGEGFKDGFKIVALQIKQQNIIHRNNFQQTMKNQSNLNSASHGINIQKTTTSILSLITKCGYIFEIIHETQFRQKSKLNTTTQQNNFSFFSEPTKLIENVGQASLFQAKTILSSVTDKEYRKNYVIKSISNSSHQNIILLNDRLFYKAGNHISLLKFDDLKTGVFQSTKYEQFYLSTQEFQNKFQKRKVNEQTIQGRNLFQNIRSVRRNTDDQNSQRFYKLFNNQQRWTAFDNQGRFHIYLFQLKHIILTYLYFQCEFITQFHETSSHQNYGTNSMIQTDLRLHSIMEKIIRIYGYSNFMKSIAQILINNSNNQRQYFYLQKQLFFQILKKQFEFELPNKFEDWFYNLTQRDKAQKIVPTQKILQFVWITLFQYQHKNLLSSQKVFHKSPSSDYFKMADQFQQLKTKVNYTSYGYGLKSLFFDTIQTFVYFRAKQYNLKQKQIRRCRQNLILLSEFLDNKKSKSQTTQYRNYVSKKLENLLKNKQKNIKNNGKLGFNATLSTNYSNSLEDSFFGLNQNKQFINRSNFINQATVYQSNQNIQKSIKKAIQKIITLLNVMEILIEKDQREGLPNFIEIITSIKNQIKLGELFFKEELFISQNNVEFVHPQLVKEVQFHLPQLKLENKINYLKFKASRNIIFGSTLNQTDLKSLDFNRLSSIVSSSQIEQIRNLFLSSKSQFNFQKAYSFAQFLALSLQKKIQKVKQLSSLKQKKFGDLSGQVRPFVDPKKVITNVNNLNVQKIILTRQQLEYQQQEMTKYFEEILSLLQKAAHNLKNTNGPQFYQIQKYFQKMLQLLIQNFGHEDVLIQSLQLILRRFNLIEKIHLMKKIRQKVLSRKLTTQKPILKISKQKQGRADQKSTFKSLFEQNNKKNLSEEKTYDTWRNNSMQI